MRTWLLIISILLLTACAHDPWTKAEKAKETAWLALHAVDHKQTQYAMDRPNEYKELNPILGKHPSKGRINTFMLTTAIGHFLITNYIPKEHRAFWQNFTLGTKAAVVGWNFHVGARIEF